LTSEQQQFQNHLQDEKKMEMKKKHWTIDKWTTTLKQMQYEHLTKHTLTYEQQQWKVRMNLHASRNNESCLSCHKIHYHFSNWQGVQTSYVNCLEQALQKVKVVTKESR
jgi:hypothetical protein